MARHRPRRNALSFVEGSNREGAHAAVRFIDTADLLLSNDPTGLGFPRDGPDSAADPLLELSSSAAQFRRKWHRVQGPAAGKRSRVWCRSELAPSGGAGPVTLVRRRTVESAAPPQLPMRAPVCSVPDLPRPVGTRLRTNQ